MSRTRVTLALLLAIITLSGCGGEPRPNPDALNKAFQSADAETKAAWDKATAARATNDFVTAILTIKKLQEQSGLTEEQRAAINQSMIAANDELSALIKKGDANATKQLEEIRRRWRSP